MVTPLSLPSELPVGERLIGIRRAYYVYGAELNAPNGPVEMSFDESGSYMIVSASNGEALTITEGPWIDSFEEPLSAENEEFVRQSGKWEIIDMGSSAWSYRQFLGRKLDRLEPGGSPSMAQSLTLIFGNQSIMVRS